MSVFVIYMYHATVLEARTFYTLKKHVLMEASRVLSHAERAMDSWSLGLRPASISYEDKWRNMIFGNKTSKNYNP